MQKLLSQNETAHLTLLTDFPFCSRRFRFKGCPLRNDLNSPVNARTLVANGQASVDQFVIFSCKTELIKVRSHSKSDLPPVIVHTQRQQDFAVLPSSSRGFAPQCCSLDEKPLQQGYTQIHARITIVYPDVISPLIQILPKHRYDLSVPRLRS